MYYFCSINEDIKDTLMAKKGKKKEDETKKVVAKCDTPDEVVAT